MLKGKNLNAQKWFRYAKQINPGCKDPYLGDAITSFKLGQIKSAIYILKTRPGQNDKKKKWASGANNGKSIEADGNVELSDTMTQTAGTCSGHGHD